MKVFEINGGFIVGVYQGLISKYDILIKYRQNVRDPWTRIRTPKHIHWTADILIKLYADREKTQEFLDFLINVWNQTKPFKNNEEREKFLSIENLLYVNQKEICRLAQIKNFLNFLLSADYLFSSSFEII